MVVKEGHRRQLRSSKQKREEKENDDVKNDRGQLFRSLNHQRSKDKRDREESTPVHGGRRGLPRLSKTPNKGESETRRSSRRRKANITPSSPPLRRNKASPPPSPSLLSDTISSRKKMVGRPKRNKLPPISCSIGHSKRGRCKCPGSVSCIQCCVVCTPTVLKIVRKLPPPISCGIGHSKNGRCKCPGSVSCIRCCVICTPVTVQIVTARTPFEKREKRETEARHLCFVVDGSSSDEDEVRTSLLKSMNIENDEQRTYKKLGTNEIERIVDTIVTYSESIIKQYRDCKTESNIRTRLVQKLSGTSGTSGTNNSMKFEANNSSSIVISPPVQSPVEVLNERDQMVELIIRILLVENQYSVPYRYLRTILTTCLTKKHLDSIKYVSIVNKNKNESDDNDTDSNRSKETVNEPPKTISPSSLASSLSSLSLSKPTPKLTQDKEAVVVTCCAGKHCRMSNIPLQGTEKDWHKCISCKGRVHGALCCDPTSFDEERDKGTCLNCHTTISSAKAAAATATALHKQTRVLFGKKAIATAGKDYDTIIQNKMLESTKRSIRRYDEEQLQNLVKFVLSEKNVGLFAWKSRRKVIRETGEVVENFPDCARKRSIADMYREYKSLPNIGKHFGKSTFFDVASLLTVDNKRVIKAVDYVQGRLINDSCGTLQRIIDVMISDSSMKKDHTRLVQVCRNFLKNQYQNHLKKDDDCCTHSIEYSLNKRYPDGTRISKYFDIDGQQVLYHGKVVCYDKHTGFYKILYDDGDECEMHDIDMEECAIKRPCNCNACKFPHFVCDQIQKQVCFETEKQVEEAESDSMRNILKNRCTDAVMVIDDVENKFVLYMAHVVRKINQQQRIKQMHQEMEEKCTESKGTTTTAKICIDWKMKWEPYTDRETTQEHYGKRGTSWHGAYIMYHEWSEEEKKAVERRKYLDQILEGDNKQDGLGVLSMVEAMLVHIKEELPFITDIILQSDNAGCYHVKELLFGMLVLGIHHGLQISRMIHTETQDGKGLIDAHFAQGSHQIHRYVATTKTNQVKKVATGQDVARALGWGGGINNSSVMLVSVNSIRQDLIKKRLSKLSVTAKSYFTRMNEIEFTSYAVNGDNDMRKLKNWNNIKFSMTCHPYSAIGPGANFECNLGNDSFVDLCDGSPAIQVKSKAMNDNNYDYDSDDEEIVSGIDDRDEFLAERQYLLDCINESSKEDSTNLQCLPTPDEKSAFYTQDGDKSMLVTKILVSELTSFSFSTTKRQQKKDVVIDESVSDEEQEKDDIEKNTRNDVRSCALRAAQFLIHSNDNNITIMIGSDETIPDYSRASNFEMSEEFVRVRGWARRQPKGKMYGATYMNEEYKKICQACFYEGERDSSKKKGPSQMYEVLVQKFPHKFSIPTDCEIRSFISALIAKEKKEKNKEGSCNDDTPTDTNNRTRFPTEYDDFIIEAIKEAIDDDKLDGLKPATVLTQAKEYFKSMKKLKIKDKQIENRFKAKFSALKSSYKAKEESGRRFRVANGY